MPPESPATGKLRFSTDEELAKRLRQVKDELVHIGYALPSLAREIDEIRKQLEPSESGDGGETGDPSLNESHASKQPPIG